MPKGHRRGKGIALSTRTHSQSGIHRHNVNQTLTDEDRRAVENRRRIEEIEERRRREGEE